MGDNLKILIVAKDICKTFKKTFMFPSIKYILMDEYRHKLKPVRTSQHEPVTSQQN